MAIDGAARLIEVLVQDAHRRDRADDLTVVIFGSALDKSSRPGDVDVWVQGSPQLVTQYRVDVSQLAKQVDFPVDIVIPTLVPVPLAVACQQQAAQGQTLLGRPLSTPSMTAGEVDRIFQMTALDRAENALDRANLLSELGLPSASGYAEAAARWLLRSRLNSDGQWRLMRRLGADDVLREFDTQITELSPAVTRHGWASIDVARELTTHCAALRRRDAHEAMSAAQGEFWIKG